MDKEKRKAYFRAYNQQPKVKARAAARYKKQKLERMIDLLQAEGYTVKKGAE